MPLGRAVGAASLLWAMALAPSAGDSATRSPCTPSPGDKPRGNREHKDLQNYVFNPSRPLVTPGPPAQDAAK